MAHEYANFPYQMLGTADNGEMRRVKVDNNGHLKLGGDKATAFEQLTINNATGGKSLTSAKYGTSNKALITVENAQIRFRVDGGVPTSTVGHIADIGDYIELESIDDIVNFKAISTITTSAVLNVTYSS